MTASRARSVTPISASRPKSATKPKSKTTTTKARNGSKTVAAKPAKAKASVAVAPPTASSEPTHEQICLRAYEIWLRKGRPVGLDEQNWKEAELELGVSK